MAGWEVRESPHKSQMGEDIPSAVGVRVGVGGYAYRPQMGRNGKECTFRSLIVGWEVRGYAHRSQMGKTYLQPLVSG